MWGKYLKEYKLNEYDAALLLESKEIAEYFNKLIQYTKNYKSAANWVMGDVKSFLNERAVHIKDFTVSPDKLAKLIQIIDEGKISHSAASQKVFPEMIKNPEKDPMEIATSLNVIQESDEGALLEIINQVLTSYPQKVADYKSGKINLLGLFMGEVMKKSGGKADPKTTSKLIKETLEKN